MSPTISELIVPVTSAEELTRLLALLAAAGFPVTDWQDGGVERTLVEVEAAELADLGLAVANIAKGGILSEATGDWLTLRALNVYALTRYLATKTTGSIVLTCAATAGPYTIAAGDLWFEGAGGNRYKNTSGGVLAAGGTLTVTVESEYANDSLADPPLSYTDASGTITKMTTPLPGVTCSNTAATFATVTLIGTGTGTIAPSGSPTSAHYVEFEIMASGQVGAGTWRYRIDGGSWSSSATINTIVNIGATGITITPSNGGTTPSFLVGDRYFVAAPGTWITTQGTDEESDAALRLRCQQRWSSLSIAPTDDCYSFWAKAASSQVTRTKVLLDTAIPGKVLIYIAGQGGALPAGVIATVQAYIDARAPITDLPYVASVSTTAVTLAGAAIVETNHLDDAQVYCQREIQTYIDSLPVGGTVRFGEIFEIIMGAPGMVDLTGFTINGSAASLVLASAKVASWAQAIATALTWARI